ncbi:amidase [Bordetella hinzii]|uniref:Amidase n=1 Tax=Bordetella hinzii TaxID=103855 RepID=A0AAN1VFF4_9BORD|nr:amidase [Bordetella hinzii]AKQ58238.1 Glutamyl-tRNA(Gln) amidotransferase subunit A [Bordetella hinzii]AZW16422.1 amidase [Bordetella hinzii]KCB43551.1 amidase [Bordetella hinzii 4161]KCB47134.1 amidase [Bordetella hinzii 1277]KXA71524.1 amidase [Bordetella hinzii LMG 13501]
MSEIAFATLSELALGLAAGQYSSVELARHFLDRIERANPALGAYVSVDREGALRLAEAADARRRSGYGSLGPLDGLPIAVKDLCDIEGQITTGGSQAWRQRRSTVTATAVTRLLDAGMVILGKTHMVEFAFGGWGTNPVMGTPRNPWDLRQARIPGGSSSGSGVAVAAGLAPAAVGSDTGGSVRIPAALNGITGLKTTRGLISLYGSIPLSTSLDSIGPLTRDTRDALMLTAALAGPDPKDPLTLHQPAPDYPARAGSLRGMRIAVMPAAQYPIDVDPATLKVLEDTRRTLAGLGADVVEAPMPFDFHDMMLRNGQIIAAEAYALHRDYIEDPGLPLGPYVRARVLGGKSISAADYIRALEAQAQACRAWQAWIADFDALLTPCLPMPPCRLEEVDETATPLAAFTRPGNYMNASGLALPAGFTDTGLPIGMQLMGAPHAEDRLGRIGMAFQAETHWHQRHPDLSAAGL